MENIIQYSKNLKKTQKILEKIHIEQIYLSHQIQIKFLAIRMVQKLLNMIFFLDGHLNRQPAKLPNDTSIVAFTGKPDPDDVINGVWPVKKSQIYKRLYKQLKTPQWVHDNWL